MKVSIITSLVTLVGLSVALPASKAPRAASNPLARRDLWCYDDCRCDAGDAQNLVNDFINQDYEVYSVGTYWFDLGPHAGDCHLFGRAVGGGQTTSSYARDVGYGAQTIVNSCYAVGTTAGSNYAGGNGNFELALQTCNP